MELESDKKSFNLKRLNFDWLSFSESFVEKDWCTKGHVGVVISGSMKVDFNGVIQKFEKGDALNIPSGKDHRHKVLMGAGDRVELMLFEEL